MQGGCICLWLEGQLGEGGRDFRGKEIEENSVEYKWTKAEAVDRGTENAKAGKKMGKLPQ